MVSLCFRIVFLDLFLSLATAANAPEELHAVQCSVGIRHALPTTQSWKVKEIPPKITCGLIINVKLYRANVCDEIFIKKTKI